MFVRECVCVLKYNKSVTYFFHFSPIKIIIIKNRKTLKQLLQVILYILLLVVLIYEDMKIQ